MGTAAIMLAFLLSFAVYLKTKRVYLGCILQILIFIVLYLAIIFVINYVNDYMGHNNSMIEVELVEEDSSCHIQRTWCMKTDNTYFFKYDRGSISHAQTPCGNDSYSDRGTFIRANSAYTIKTNDNPALIIYFDLQNKKATPVINNDTLKVVNADWSLITEYLKQH